MTSSLDLRQHLLERIKILNERIWERRASGLIIDDWLMNLDQPGSDEEELHALFLLSRFMFYGDFEVRALVRAIYRDLYRTPIVHSLRRQSGDTLDAVKLALDFRDALSQTRFLGMGNPAESGVHLLYYFRQENSIPKEQFIDSHQIFAREIATGAPQFADTSVDRYVFIDDFCGSGAQAQQYSQSLVAEIHALAARTGASVTTSYFAMCATQSGLETVRTSTSFTEAAAVVELDDSFRALDSSSRYFRDPPAGVGRDAALEMCRKYGGLIHPSAPLGYRDGQLLLGFHHNIPDNTLPIFWCEGSQQRGWRPIFRRYEKIYGWA